jgi:hypothetical protein
LKLLDANKFVFRPDVYKDINDMEKDVKAIEEEANNELKIIRRDPEIK